MIKKGIEAATSLRSAPCSTQLTSLHFSLSVNREVKGDLNVDHQEAMDRIADQTGGNHSGLTYKSGQVRNIYLQSTADQCQSISNVLNCHLLEREGGLVVATVFSLGVMPSV